MQNQSEADLVRGIRRWDLVAITINGIIGAGIFGLPSKVYSLIGTYSLIAFVACALVVALIILCFAEVSSRFDETGGPYLYARAAYAPAVAFEVGWLIWLVRVTAFNRGPEPAMLHLLPQIWFRNTWTWDTESTRPLLMGCEARVAKCRAGSARPFARIVASNG